MTSQWKATVHPSFYGVNFNPTEHPDELATVDGHALKNGTLITQYLNVDDVSLAARLWVAGANSGAPLETPGFQEVHQSNTINVRSLGADNTGVTDAAPFINAAIQEAKARDYGTVYIPAGHYLIGSTLVLDSLIHLRGDGMATYLRAKTNLNAPMIEAYNEASVRWAYMLRITDLRLDGNRDNQSSAANAHGIKWHAPSGATAPLFVPELVGHNYSARLPEVDPVDNWPETRHDLHNVFVSYCAGDGFNMAGRGGLKASHLTAYECQGYGFVPTYDSSFVSCEAARNGKSGFYIAQSAVHLTSCKAWWSGYRKPSDVEAYATHGYEMIADTRGAMLVSCEAQDNYASGFSFSNALGHACYGCIADSNNRRNGDNVGVDFYSSYGNVWEGIVYDRYNDSIRYQDYALRFRSNSYQNRVKLNHRYYNGGAATYGQLLQHISPDSDTYQNNEIEINNQCGMQKVSPGTIAPSVFHGGTVLCNLTQNTTVNYDPTGTHIPPGARLKFVFVQDATGGRTVTFNSSFYRTSWTPDTTANKINTIEFTWNNESSRWVQSAVATGI